MKVGNKSYRTIWVSPEKPEVVQIIDQRLLPHQFVIKELNRYSMVAEAIKDMWVRGAGLIGASGAYGIYLASLTLKQNDDFVSKLTKAAQLLKSTRPTAVNLGWAIDIMLVDLKNIEELEELKKKALTLANQIANEDAEMCRSIGQHGLQIIQRLHQKNPQKRLNILTHCNAGWLAFVDYGSALSPIYAAHEKGIPVHVWVDETRPRNQGASLTAWELKEHGIPHSIIADNTGGHLMQHGLVDMVIVGSDRTTRTGDVANKIGTYLKALAAFDNHIPFYAALPSSTIDWNLRDGIKEIPIEERDAHEIKYMSGLSKEHKIEEILICPKDSPAINYGFDVTPARLITGIITERGISKANEEEMLNLYPERKSQ